MVKNAGSKNKRGRLMKNMKSPNSGLNSDQKILYMKRWIMVGGLTATRKPLHEKVSDSGWLHSDQ